MVNIKLQSFIIKKWMINDKNFDSYFIKKTFIIIWMINTLMINKKS